MISVCIATFNGERYLAQQLDSILQSPLVGEVLVSDDGSTDSTREVARRFGDGRVRLLDGPGAGLVRNYEFLLMAAAGQHIFLADQDDVWLPRKVELLTARLQQVDLVVSDCVVVDSTLSTLRPSFFADRHSGPGLVRNLVRNSYLGCCMAFNRSLLAYALPFPTSVPMHDWWLGLVAEAFASVDFVDEPLVLYRRHGGNASSTSEGSPYSLARQLAWRSGLIANLGGRWWKCHGQRPSVLL
jgi:glycosyltransferase involved in cell wall biosynthesis